MKKETLKLQLEDLYNQLEDINQRHAWDEESVVIDEIVLIENEIEAIERYEKRNL